MVIKIKQHTLSLCYKHSFVLFDFRKLSHASVVMCRFLFFSSDSLAGNALALQSTTGWQLVGYRSGSSVLYVISTDLKP